MSLSIAVATRDALLTSYGTNFNGASLEIFAGAVPADADTALSGQTLLGTVTFGATAFGAAAAGSMAANAIAQANAVATGAATFYRVLNGATVIEQGTVTATGGGGDLQLNTTSIVSGAPIDVTSFVRSM